MKSYKELKERQRVERDGYNEFLEVRVHRSLSWLNRAEQCTDDIDGQAIFLWIAFNAAYANEIDPQYRPREQDLFLYFLQRLCELDDNKRLENLVWVEFSKSIRILLDNKYIFSSFWDYQNDNITEEEWKYRFSQDKAAATRALSRKDTSKVLAIVLSRIYTLRNQLIHGGATWNSNVNRDQIRDCAKFMGCLVPVVIEIMMDNADVLWGQPCYPVV